MGVPIWIMSELGILPPTLRTANYSRLSNGDLIVECSKFCTPLEDDEVGCLVVIRWPGEQEAGHVAIRTELGILHAYRNHGGVKEHGYRARWPEWTDSFWRLPGVSGG